MAATDQNYRNQRALDIVFAASSVLMLLSVLWMLVQDYNREFKKEQRRFRDVETALAQRLALEQLPSSEEIAKAEQAVAAARKARKEEKKKDGKTDEERLEENRAKIQKLMPARDRADVAYQNIKADLASVRSFYDIGVEENMSPGFIQRQKDEIARLETELIAAEVKKDAVMAEIDPLRQENDRIEKPLIDALSDLKKITDKFDAQVKIAADKRWGWGDRLRNLPILDGFAPPLKIHQFTINDVPIDYNFAYTTRFDRCMTCHLGIDRPAYTPEAIASLTFVTTEQRQNLLSAREMLKKRKDTLAGLPEARHVPDPAALRLARLHKDYLTPSKIKEFCAHPRLDLFVGGNSKHPAERFGCTSCHAGQGSATSFSLASHAPNSYPEEKRWKKEHGWESNHYWDFPMLPMRFVESSCLKCHHEVTDLIGSNNRQEAPKLLQGFNTIKDFGCFGCHEINGRKKGRPVGPDLRLEPMPPLDELTAAERTRIESDPDTAPGNMRKVGPSLFRISEKTNKEWLTKWLRAPREFRPDTKMPHFYGLSNNDEKVLPDDQKKFPDAEIQSISHYLFRKSAGYLKDVAERHNDKPDLIQKEQERIERLESKERLDDAERQELEKLRERKRQRSTPLLVDLAPKHKADVTRGRALFSERGCLACHSHDATMTSLGKKGEKDYVPAIKGEAQFGPNLSQLRDKLGVKANDPESSRNWLIQWLIDPHVYSPRSRMPVTHLTPAEAADIAAWLIAQPAKDMGPGWNSLAVKEPSLDTLDKLARVYLVRLLSASNVDKLEKDKSLPDYVVKDLPVEERELLTSLNRVAKLDRSNADQARAAESATQDSLKMYLGRKAILRLGCFACHDIPGYESAKPIGTELNEWGKKDPTKLAFENINNFVNSHFNIVDKLTDAKGNPVGPEGGKSPMEKFFYDLLTHQQREGYLYQKLQDPRSYDYQRERAWDDRSRMPQFRFARARQKKGETDAAFAARASLEEAKAREAVMTFVLGLVAEPIPMKSINQPSGDRLAEVKGRQVLDKFNCAGCHMIRPGYFEFKASEDVTQDLERQLKVYKNSDGWKADHVFPEHHNWIGPYPSARDKLSALGIQARLNEEETDNPALSFRLANALRFQGKDNDWQDIRALFQISPPLQSMIYPPREALSSPEKLKAFMKEQGPYGGTFADLLVPYLISKKDYPKNEMGDSADARIEVPPSLLGQGERTQTDWLYQFLLNPTQVRRMTVLRMPRFNMSKEEAKILVSYFAGVEKINNPGIGLRYPYEEIPQQEPLDAPFWKAKNAAYVSRLKQTKPLDPKSKEASLYDVRLNELQPIWQQILKDSQDKEAVAKAKLDAVKPLVKEAEAAAEKATAELKKAKENDKDGKEKATKDLEEAQKRIAGVLDRVKQDEFFWINEVNAAEKRAAASKIDAQRKSWEERDAYVTDAFRLVANTQLCVKCHQFGDLRPGEGVKEGPPLSHVYNRLRPGWARRWISDPVRLHDTVMPVNFPAGATPDFQQYVAGSALEQATAARDVLLMYPRAIAMPANQYWLRPLIAEKKGNTGEKK
ncbi:MAG: cytochrome c [Planctomycetes bacterium]|nr:cytochrome c [Planctomycetota bacterium]